MCILTNMKTTTEQLLNKRTNALLSIEKILFSLKKIELVESKEEQGRLLKIEIAKIDAIVADGLVTKIFLPPTI